MRDQWSTIITCISLGAVIWCFWVSFKEKPKHRRMHTNIRRYRDRISARDKAHASIESAQKISHLYFNHNRFSNRFGPCSFDSFNRARVYFKILRRFLPVLIYGFENGFAHVDNLQKNNLCDSRDNIAVLVLSLHKLEVIINIH